MWVRLLTDRIDDKLEKSNLINEHALIREPVPLTFPQTDFWEKKLYSEMKAYGLYYPVYCIQLAMKIELQWITIL